MREDRKQGYDDGLCGACEERGVGEREPYQDGAAASNGPTNAMGGPVNAILIPEFGLVKSQLILRGTRHGGSWTGMGQGHMIVTRGWGVCVC